MARLDVMKSRELQATILTISALPRTLQKMNRQHTKRVAEPEFKAQVNRRASTELERRVISSTATVSVSNTNVRMQSAGKGRPLSGGLSPKIDYPGVEFGSHAKGKTYDRKNRKRGGTHKVTRVMGTQFKRFNRDGYVFYPSAKAMVPRLARLWVQTTVKTVANALKGKEE